MSATGHPVTLERRALNCATLARQHLLARSDLPALDAVEQLVGLQAQTPQTWYVGLWSRLAGFDAAAVGDALIERTLVRVPLMRSTIHLVTAADALALRPLTQVPIERSTLGAFGRHLREIDRDALVARARELVDTEPLIASELGRRLAEHFPGRDPGSLAQGARAWLPMVQVPPRGVWGRSGRPLQATLEGWLGEPMCAMPVGKLVTRYLAAFGPATIRDIQTWCGLTKLAEVVEDLRPRLVSFQNPDGPELFDLPDAPRPDPDTPAPVRYLYDYDNLLLSHADRSRVVREFDYGSHGYTADSNRQPSSLLVDGSVAGTWTVTRESNAKRKATNSAKNTAKGGMAVLTVRGFRRFTGRERDAITAEGAALLQFLHPSCIHDVRC